MFTHLPRQGNSPQGTHPQTATRRAGTRVRWLAAVLAAVTGLLASAAAVPAAFAMPVPVPDPGGQYATTGPAPAPAATVRVIAGGGMPGWQITLIALGAALLAGAVAVLLDRALATRRAASAPAA
jgi:hypothetical protein